MDRKELMKKKLDELLEFLVEKDEKYAKEEPFGNIMKIGENWHMEPSRWCCIRINEKINRMLQNPENREIRREELTDIWGYCLIGLILMDKEDISGTIDLKRS